MTDVSNTSIDSPVPFCGQCGHKNLPNFRFCQSCGQPAQAPVSTAQMDMTEQDIAATANDMTLGKATLLYIGFMALNFVALLLAIYTGVLGPLLLVTYLFGGYWMTRKVMGQLIEWHPNYNTLDNVVGGKLRMFFLWPFAMPTLLIKLGFDKAL